MTDSLIRHGEQVRDADRHPFGGEEVEPSAKRLQIDPLRLRVLKRRTNGLSGHATIHAVGNLLVAAAAMSFFNVGHQFMESQCDYVHAGRIHQRNEFCKPVLSIV